MVGFEVDQFVQKMGRYVVVLILIFALDGVGVLKPLKQPIEQTTNLIAQLRQPVVEAILLPWQMVSYYRSGTARIVDLESRLAEAVVDKSLLEQLITENNDMRNLLESPLPPEWTYIVAPVIGVHSQELVIGAGSVQGVSVGNTVVYQEILVGRVKKVSVNQSRVLLVTAPSSKVAAQVSGTRVDGLVQGEGEFLSLTQVLQNADVQPSQVVVTAGLDGIAPRLVIGRIESVETNDAGLFQQAKVVPAVENSDLSTVFIIKE